MKYEELSEEAKETALEHIIDRYSDDYIESELRYIVTTTMEEWDLPEEDFGYFVDYNEAYFWCKGELQIYYKAKWEEELQKRGWLKYVIRSIIENCKFQVVREANYSYIENTEYNEEQFSESDIDVFTEALNDIYAEIVETIEKELEEMYRYYTSKDFAFEMLSNYDLEFNAEGELYETVDY